MKNIIITGSSSGFGLVGVKTLALKGHRVFATMRNIAGTNAANAAEITKWAQEHNAQVEIIELDVTSNASVTAAINAIAQKTSNKIDVFINNAGISYMGVGEALTIEQTEQLYQVNTLGPERTIKTVLPYMHAQKSGLIINVTSVQTRHFIPILSTYNGTKAAVDAVTVGYHYELKPSGIDVVSIQPGGYQTTDITTKSLQPLNPDAEKNYAPEVIEFKDSVYRFFVPNEESRDPQEVADAMLALVESPQGQRPLWTVVGGGPQTESFEAINNQIDAIVKFSLDIFPKAFPAN